jgi:penicillin amidase
MKLKTNRVVLDGRDGKIEIKRNRYGIPEISAQSLADLQFGLGWVHASDRQIQVLLTRILLQGRAAECLKGDEALIEIDKYMRRMNFLPDPEEEIEKLEDDIKTQVASYADGFNLYLSDNKPVYEFRLMGYKPDPWDIRDSLLIAKIVGFIGLADAQGNMEKLLIQMIQNDVEEAKLREFFPYLTEEIDYDLIKKISLDPPLVPEAVKWLDKLFKFSASNNWAVSGNLTESGKPILCGDPHLEVNRLPSVWQEIVMILPDNKLMGVGMPGLPGLIIGRTNDIAWSATYSFMDMLDYRIEYCRDGKYKREDGWKDFTVRKEIINVKKGAPIEIEVYENEHGLLEGNPEKEGHYLVLGWSAKDGCGSSECNGILNLPHAKNVREAMDCFKMPDAVSMNWVVADSVGNIGYQMSGRLFNRPPGVSGMLALPAWETKYDNDGFVDKDKLPSLYNPADGIVVTTNQDLNYLGEASPINLPMGTYRAERIRDLLLGGEKLNVEYMKKIHFDLYSLQAERLMKTIRPLLPDTEKGKILREWDMRYDTDSKGAMLFESVYRALVNVVFGDHGLGRDVVDYIMKETSLFNDYYPNLDDVLLSETSAWFEDKEKGELFKEAIEKGLKVDAVRYGENRKIMLSHLLFGGQIPSIFGYDYGPVELPGSCATIPQGQIFKSAGRVTTFCPSYRIIADMAYEGIHTNIAGGPTDRRFSRWYTSDVKNWIYGVYKVLK